MQRRSSPTHYAVLLMLALAWGFPARGAEVIYLGQPAGTAAAGQALVTLAGYAADVDTAAPRHLLEVFPPGVAAPLGASDEQRCNGQPLDGAGYRASLDDAYQATMDLEDSRPTLAAIRASQACLTEVVDPDELAYPFFLEGVLEVSDGNADAAHEAFRSVFAIHLDYAWDSTYPPDAHDGFSRALADVARGTRVRVTSELGEGTEVWVDGAALDGGALETVAGRHVLQIRPGPGEPLRSGIIVVEGDVRVVDPGELGLGGALTAEQLPAALADVEGLLRTRGPDADETFVVDAGESPAAWFWDVDGARLDPLSRALAGGGRSRGGKGAPPKALAPVLAGVGGGLVLAGGLIAGLGWDDLRSFNASVEAGELGAFPGPDHPDPDSVELYGTWQRKVRTVDAGLALLAGGGVTLAVALPVGLAARDRGRQVTLATRIQPALDPASPGIEGFSFTLSVR